MKSRSVTIMLTNSCNLNCIYCYEVNKSKREINSNIAYTIIDKEMLLDDGYECIEFNLFGGEPFLRFDIIKDIYSYLRSKSYNKEWKIGIITNGTVLNKEHKLWLSTHKDRLIITLSIDGTKSMQDRNRNNSFDMLDLDFFVNTFDIVYAKMTIGISRPTAYDLLQEKKFRWFKIGNKYRISKNSFDKWLDRQTEE